MDLIEPRLGHFEKINIKILCYIKSPHDKDYIISYKVFIK